MRFGQPVRSMFLAKLKVMLPLLPRCVRAPRSGSKDRATNLGYRRKKSLLIDVALVPVEIQDNQQLADSAVIVIDVLRATSTIITALDAGAASVVAVADVEEARGLAAALGDSAVLGGERGGVTLPGFQLGNSPLEYTSELVSDRMVVLTTTNGTYTLHKVYNAAEVAVAAFLNAEAAARWGKAQLQAGRRLLLACAGTMRRFAREDACCAGLLVGILRKQLGEAVQCTDGAFAAEQLWISAERDALQVLHGSSHGAGLIELGFEADLTYCAQQSVSESVPELCDGRLVLDKGSRG